MQTLQVPGGIETKINQICEIFETADEAETLKSNFSLVVDGPREDLLRRCGQIFENAYDENQQYLFLEYLKKVNGDKKNGLTTFCVRKHVYNAFFPIRSLDLPHSS